MGSRVGPNIPPMAVQRLLRSQMAKKKVSIQQDFSKNTSLKTRRLKRWNEGKIKNDKQINYYGKQRRRIELNGEFLAWEDCAISSLMIYSNTNDWSRKSFSLKTIPRNYFQLWQHTHTQKDASSRFKGGRPFSFSLKKIVRISWICMRERTRELRDFLKTYISSESIVVVCSLREEWRGPPNVAIHFGKQ